MKNSNDKKKTITHDSVSSFPDLFRYLRQQMGRRWFYGLPSILMAVIVLLIWLVPGSKSTAAPPTAEAPLVAPPPAPAFVYTPTDRPPPLKLSDHPTVAAVIAHNKKISSLLTHIRTRLTNIQTAYRERVEIEKDFVKAIDAILPLSHEARSDIDFLIRTAEDIQFELEFSSEIFQGMAKLFKRRADRLEDSQFKKISLNTSAWFEGLVNDAPRLQKDTEKFVAAMKVVRAEMTEVVRTLEDLKTTLEFKHPSERQRPISEETRTFARQLENFIDAINKYFDRFINDREFKDPLPENVIPK